MFGQKYRTLGVDISYLFQFEASIYIYIYVYRSLYIDGKMIALMHHGVCIEASQFGSSKIDQKNPCLGGLDVPPLPKHTPHHR